MARTAHRPDDGPTPGHRALIAASAAAPRRRRRRLRLRPGLVLPAAALAGAVAVLAVLRLGGGDASRAPADLRDELISVGVEAPAGGGSRSAPARPKALRTRASGSAARRARDDGAIRGTSAGEAERDDPGEALEKGRVPAPGLALTAPAGTEPQVTDGRGAPGRDSTAEVAVSAPAGPAPPAARPGARERS